MMRMETATPPCDHAPPTDPLVFGRMRFEHKFATHARVGDD